MERALRWIAILTVVLAAGLSSAQEPSEWTSQLKNLPAYTPPVTLPEWQSRRSEILETIRKLLGDLPKPVLPRVTWSVKQDSGDYTLERFVFENGDGAVVPGYFLLPKNRTGKIPAILYCHCHGGQYSIGKDELFQTRFIPEPPGPALVRRGWAVLAVDAYGFGERRGKGPDGPFETDAGEELSTAKFNLWLGRTMWGMIIRDDRMALDVLLTRPEVDSSRVAATGFSMGAARAWWSAALDERIKAGVAVGFLMRSGDLIATGALGKHGIYYYVPGLLRHFDAEAVISLIAPRPFLFLTGDRDPGSPLDGVKTINACVSRVYDLYGKSQAYQSEIFPGAKHEYTADMWEQTLDWLEKELNGR